MWRSGKTGAATGSRRSALVFYAALLFFLPGVLVFMPNAWILARWERTRGRILEHRLDIHGEKLNALRDDRIVDTDVFFDVDVRYSYSVGGKEYVGRRYRLMELPSRILPRQAAKLAPGDAVTVHYDPDRPASSVLDVSVPLVCWLLWAVGVTLAVLSAVLRVASGASEQGSVDPGDGREKD